MLYIFAILYFCRVIIFYFHHFVFFYLKILISGTNKEGVKVAQINHMSFKYPASPLLSQPENTPTESICSLERRSRACTDTPLFCECIQVIEVSQGKHVDIVLIDEGMLSGKYNVFYIDFYLYVLNYFIFRFWWKYFSDVSHTWL